MKFRSAITAVASATVPFVNTTGKLPMIGI
jgi:hypothetical protein